MSCEWGYTDCSNLEEKCFLCVNELHYLPIKKRNFGISKSIKVKETKRKGSMNEVIAYNQIKDAVEGTPNSGAGAVKGDLQIGSMAMIECKTTTEKNKGRQPGKESFSLQRGHLEKLEREAKEARKEFHFLVFSFKEHDEKLYVVSDLDQYNSMISTMKQDRLALTKSENIINVHKTRTALIDAENSKLLAEIEHLKAKLKHSENKDKEIFE